MRRLAAGALALVAMTACVRAARPDAAPGGFIGEGWASFYGEELRGRRTASGETFNPASLTAAHRSLPFGTCVRVVRPANRRAVDVWVNDRGPYTGDRIIDLSQAAAGKLGMMAQGVVRVRLYFCPR